MGATSPSSSTEPEPSLSCATLPYSGIRILEAHEVTKLRARRKRELNRLASVISFAIIAALIYLVAVVLLIGLAIELLGDSVSTAVILTGTLIGLVGAAVGILRVNDRCKVHQHEMRVLEAALKDPSVRQFSGTLSRNIWYRLSAEPALEKLLDLKLLDFNDRNPHVLELFLRSGAIYRMDDHYSPTSALLPLQRTAPRPEDAPEFAVPNSWIAPGTEPPNVERRRLSASEIGELRDFIRRTNRALLIQTAAVPLAAAYFGERLGRSFNLPWIGGICGAALGAALPAWSARKTRSLVRRLRADVEETWVVIGAPDAHQVYDTRKRAHEQSYIEVLPHSGLWWTIDGTPAAWRGRKA